MLYRSYIPRVQDVQLLGFCIRSDKGKTQKKVSPGTNQTPTTSTFAAVSLLCLQPASDPHRVLTLKGCLPLERNAGGP
jgi:hypothetical protein